MRHCIRYLTPLRRAGRASSASRKGRAVALDGLFIPVLALSLIVGLVLGEVSRVMSQESPLDAAYRAGSALAERGQWAEALRQFRLALQYRPGDPTIAQRLAQCYIQLEQYTEAERLLRQIITVKPDFYRAYIGLGFVLTQTGSYVQAKDAFENAVRLNPNDANSHFNLGMIHARFLDHARAQAEFQRAVQLNARHMAAWYNLGLVYTEQQTLTEARSAFQRALALAPNNSGPYYGLGHIALREQRYVEAQRLFQKAIDLEPGFTKAYYGLGTAFIRGGHRSEGQAALKQFQTLTALDEKLSRLYTESKSRSNDPALHLTIGQALLEANRFDQALRHFRAALWLDPARQEARRGLMKAQAELQREDRESTPLIPP